MKKWAKCIGCHAAMGALENNKAEKGVGRVEQGCWACSFESGGQGGLAENVTLEQSHEQNA